GGLCGGAEDVWGREPSLGGPPYRICEAVIDVCRDRIGLSQTCESDDLSLVQYSCHAFRYFASRYDEWPDEAVKVKAIDGEAVSGGDRRRWTDRPGAGGA